MAPRLGKIVMEKSKNMGLEISKIAQDNLQAIILVIILLGAFSIRLFSVLKFESIIHEFDPWFNYRATKYLVKNGWRSFINWYDSKVWYPMGRHVGSTVYPGLMIVGACLNWLLNDVLRLRIDVKDICVFMAPVVSAATVMATWLFTREISDDVCALFAAAFIAVCPGYISRSVAGSYDNECISIFLMMATFYCWIKSVRDCRNDGEDCGGDEERAFWCMATTAFYYAMVASWGGYAFVINLIPLHVLCCLVFQGFSEKIYRSYSMFYLLGTVASTNIPFVGLKAIVGSEHLAALGVFGILQLFQLGNVFSENIKSFLQKKKKIQIIVFFGCSICALLVLMLYTLVTLTNKGVINPWQGRFISMFRLGHATKHIPIIASISEHQPTPWTNFFYDLQFLIMLAPVGLWMCVTGDQRRKGNSRVSDENAEGYLGDSAMMFVLVYTATSAYFASVMIRLMLTMAPIMCILGGVVAGTVIARFPISKTLKTTKRPNSSSLTTNIVNSLVQFTVLLLSTLFLWHCTWVTHNSYSSPTLMLSSVNKQTGTINIIDDWRESYNWLHMNTAKESIVASWWDYGYQLSGMSQRITITDNNTWNYAHIGKIGLLLALDEKRALEIIQELDIDYILILSGVLSGYAGDDMNKLMWIIKIADADHPGILTESDYLSADGNGLQISKEKAPKTLSESLLYKMTYYGLPPSNLLGPSPQDAVRKQSIEGLDPILHILSEVYTSKNSIIRIFKVKQKDPFGKSLFATK